MSYHGKRSSPRGSVVEWGLCAFCLLAAAVVALIGLQRYLFGVQFFCAAGGFFGLMALGRLLRHGDLLRRGLLGVLLAGILCFAVMEGLVISGDNGTWQGEIPDALIVLGTTVEGTQPSNTLRERLDTAYDWYQAHPEVLLVVTGGKGDGEQMSEGDVMAEYLIARGVPQDAILRETRARNTWQNFQYSIGLLSENTCQADSLLVISSASHLYRAALLASRAGAEEVYTLAAPQYDFFSGFYAYAREGFGLVKSYLFDR